MLNYYKDKLVKIKEKNKTFSLWTSKPRCSNCLKPLEISLLADKKAKYFALCKCLTHISLDIEGIEKPKLRVMVHI